MKALSAPNDIILYNYEFSPFGKRITTYLAVRGIDYAICEQPFTMPRPDLKLLSIAYRRIPILAIGRDIYLDTRCQLRKLETLFPNNQMLDATNSQDLFVQQLLERYMVEGPVFRMAAGLMPVQEDMFRKDRKGFLGRSWGKEELDDGRGTCLAYIRGLFTLFEGTVLSDGREWVLGGEKLSLADIEALWALDFSSNMQFPPELISPAQFPRVFAWLDRYRAVREEAKASAPKPTMLDGQAAANHIFRSELSEMECSVDEGDPLGLKKGDRVEIFPADWGSECRDRGTLVGLTPAEVIISVRINDVEIRVHAPRTGFEIKEIDRE